MPVVRCLALGQSGSPALTTRRSAWPTRQRKKGKLRRDPEEEEEEEEGSRSQAVLLTPALLLTTIASMKSVGT